MFSGFNGLPPPSLVPSFERLSGKPSKGLLAEKSVFSAVSRQKLKAYCKKCRYCGRLAENTAAESLLQKVSILRSTCRNTAAESLLQKVSILRSACRNTAAERIEKEACPKTAVLPQEGGGAPKAGRGQRHSTRSELPAINPSHPKTGNDNRTGKGRLERGAMKRFRGKSGENGRFCYLCRI